MDQILYAIIMGIVQGLTEFLPVSSSGHLALLGALFDIGESALTLSVMLHAGTLAAVCVAYRKDIAEILRDLWNFARSLAGKEVPSEATRGRGMRILMMVIVSLLPLFVVFPFKGYIESVFSSTILVGCLLLVTAVLLLIADRLAARPGQDKDVEKTTWKDALVVGIFQTVALLPGISRSGSTITGGFFRRFKREYAVKFSFLMSIPTILAALLLDILDILGGGMEPELLLGGLIGMVVSGVTGYFAIGMVNRIAKSGKFAPFSVWCAVVGVVTVIVSLVR
ncbi:MAG: undecaprenyl-diphosphate phosphatase [Clostridia bacterium]|nr:undecaprenyl-diphosphate phosphatase [Clostridia bacterium]